MSDSFEGTSNLSSLDQIREGEDNYGLGVASEKSVTGNECIAVGEYLPYGLRMFYQDSYTVVRMKDIGVKNRIIVVGVLGSFTPDCWNRHFFQILKKLRYYQERDVAHICCISTNDAYTQVAWGDYLGCNQNVLMWADPYKHFTKKIGMDIVIPWLNETERSKRYVILADDMQVTKMIVAPKDELVQNWQCDHLPQKSLEDDDDDDDDYVDDFWV